MPNNGNRNLLDIVELGLSGVAIAISIIALVVSIRLANKSNDVAVQALAIAEQSNRIALGEAESPPVVEILDSASNLSLTSEDEIAAAISNEKAMFSLKNRGDVAVSGLLVKFIAHGGLTYAVNSPSEDYRDMEPQSTPQDFQEQLSTDGIVTVDLTVAIARYLRDLKLDYKDRDETYRSTINVVIVPKKSGDELATPTFIAKDNALVTVEFVPNVLGSEGVSKMLSENETVIRVFPASVDGR